MSMVIPLGTSQFDHCYDSNAVLYQYKIEFSNILQSVQYKIMLICI